MIRIREVGHAGISADKPPRDVPPQFVQKAHNITVAGGTLNADWGFQKITDTAEQITHLQPISDARIIRSLLLLSDTKAYSWHGGTILDITTNPLVAPPDGDRVTSDEIGGIAIWGWHGDAPRYWSPPQGGNEQYLPWSASETWSDKLLTAKVVRTYKNFIVVGHVDDGNTGIEQPRKVMWSESVTDTLTLPYWDVTTDNDAGFVTLEDLPAGVIDMHVLGDTLIIYGSTSAYMMQYVGGAYIMRFQHLPNLKGCAGTGLVIPFLGMHFVVSTEDVYVHSGGTTESIVDEKIRQLIFDSVKDTTFDHAYLVHNVQLQEIWLCMPIGDDTFCSIAYAWNYEKNVWTTRDLPASVHAASGVTPACLDGHCPEWDTLPVELEWGSWVNSWAETGGINSDVVELLLAKTDSTLHQRKTGLGDFTPPLVERVGIDLSDDYRTQHTIQTIYPSITDGVALVQVGVQAAQGSGIHWSKPQRFDPYLDKKLDVRGDNLTGSLWCYRVYSEERSLFQFSGIEIETVPAGKD